MSTKLYGSNGVAVGECRSYHYKDGSIFYQYLRNNKIVGYKFIDKHARLINSGRTKDSLYVALTYHYNGKIKKEIYEFNHEPVMYSKTRL